MSANLKPGTLCFLRKVGGVEWFAGKQPVNDLNGRVVEVIAGPRAEWGPGPGPFYDIRATWILDRFPGRDLIALREQLIPISPGFGEMKRARGALVRRAAKVKPPPLKVTA